MNLLTIAVLSLSIGLIAGAGANENFILPVTLSAAVIFYFSRNKIAAQEISWQLSEKNAQHDIIDRTKAYFAWPERNKFDCPVSGELYIDQIHQLIHKIERGNEPAEISNEGHIELFLLTAYLIPAHSNPTHPDQVQIVIGNKVLGLLTQKDSKGFQDLLEKMNLQQSITTCQAVIRKNVLVDQDTSIFRIMLDLELLETTSLST